MDYLSVEEARDRAGLKLVLTAGAPGPWGEAAKAILRHHGLAFLAVAQEAMGENGALKAWTGHRNAPILVAGDAAVFTGWHDILAFAERTGGGTRLLPEQPAARAEALGLSALIAGPEGLGWTLRAAIMGLMVPTDTQAQAGLPMPVREAIAAYGVTAETLAAAPDRLTAILGHLDRRLEDGPFLLGSKVSAPDIYWASFSNMLAPLPRDVSPMPEPMWNLYGNLPGRVLAAVTPRLLAHRDFLFAQHIGLPLDF
ncbi:MAG: glutathione S-transferase family protein [Thermaurantiacus sp.]